MGGRASTRLPLCSQVSPCPVSNLDDAGHLSTRTWKWVSSSVPAAYSPTSTLPPLPPTRPPATSSPPRYTSIYLQCGLFIVTSEKENFHFNNKWQNLLSSFLRSSLAKAHHPYDCCNAQLHINLKGNSLFLPIAIAALTPPDYILE